MNETADERFRAVDQFEILRELGRGGTSVVYLVTDRESGSLYAMKLLRKDVPDRTLEALREASEQLLAESEVLRTLGEEGQENPGPKSPSPGIPSYGGKVCDEDGRFAGFLMEYVEGRSLRELLEEGEVFSVREAAQAGLELCGILGRLHGQKPSMIYRDLKPANILVRPDRGLVLVDYGAVRKYRKSAAGDTDHLGTEGYAAPEQYGGWEQSDERTDIYGIGAVLHHMITGRPPLETGLRPLGEILSGPDADSLSQPGRDRSRLPRQYADMGKILMRCCMTAPSLRYSSCGELEKALRSVLRMCLKDESAENKAAMAGVRSRSGTGKSRSWSRFIRLATAAAAFMICALIFAALSAGAGRMEYRRIIEEMEEEQDPVKKAQVCRRALVVRPEDPRACLCFLKDLAEDSVITPREKELLDSVLYAGGNPDRMREKRPGEYAILQMELGKVYFGCYEGGTEAAEICFRNALEAGGLWMSGRKTAEAMEIVLGEKWGPERIKAWEVLERESMREAEETGDAVFAAAVCKAAAAEIALFSDRYLETGADGAALKEVTENAERFMRELQDGQLQVPERMETELRTAVESARRAADRPDGKDEKEPERTQIGEAE